MTPLSDLLTPYRSYVAGFEDDQARTEDDRNGWYFRDAPADVATSALELVEPVLATSRPNGQPPAEWLADRARRMGGTVVGFAAPERDDGYLRIDGIKVPWSYRRDLVRLVADTWPDEDDEDGSWPGALDLAVGEVYPAWHTLHLVWKGPGADLAGDVPEGPVVGLWWD